MCEKKGGGDCTFDSILICSMCYYLHAEGAEEGPARVDELDLAVALEGLGVGREAGGVPAVVAGELAVQVGGHVALGEGAQEARAVGAVPLARLGLGLPPPGARPQGLRVRMYSTGRIGQRVWSVENL
jgi:hypothetical protein